MTPACRPAPARPNRPTAGPAPCHSAARPVIERQQYDHRHPVGQQFAHLSHHPFLAAPLEQVSDEDDDRVARAGDAPASIGQRPVNVRPPAQPQAEQQLHRVAQLVADVHHGRVEQHQPRRQRRNGSQHGRGHPGIDDRGGHRGAGVHQQDDVAQRRLPPAVADQPLRHDRLLCRLVVAQIGLDGARPVDLGQAARPVAAAGAVEAAGGRLAQRVVEPPY